ncbi:sensor histidine kinase [Thermodesulfobacterium sp. TA1]|uniref:sensor histidine kinase n=1 Tax=Thermodesulfobacterium sp. TA1 TaxID=2234087 RepID=UPI00143D8DD4|nr:ATP-binding protein [Thermodesulfobacterium sp. TA1]
MENSIIFTKDSIEKINYPTAISECERVGLEFKHKIVYYNSRFLRDFIYLLKDDEVVFLEELFGPVFDTFGLTFFTFENNFYYLFNLPINPNYTIHVFIQEKDWFRFPYWINTERLASLGKLAGEISHELKNPLSGILLYASMLKEEIGEVPTYQTWLERIISLTERCRMIINGLLTFGRPEEEKREWVEVNFTIKKVYELLSEYPLFKNIKFNLKLQTNLPQIYASQGQIEQVLFNLFINAAQAMKGKGEITVETFFKNDTIVIKVKDTGPGIPSEIMPFIFDPFFTTKEKGEATGLGLSICYGIIKNHGGRINVYNLKEGGACFEILFPLLTREALREDAV